MDEIRRLRIPYPIIVEGRYDKSAILGMFSATVVTTDGFGVFNSKEKQMLIKKIAADGIIVLTDSDAGGKQIRSFISSFVPKDRIYQLYIPRIEGKERRKRAPSKSGMLGVEGMGADFLHILFLPFADGASPRKTAGLEKRDFYIAGLSGGENSAKKRAALCALLSLPEDMTANALLEAINLLYTKEEFQAAIKKLSDLN